jgi:hypothetical protein
MVTTMRHVATAAVTLFDGPMEIFLVLDLVNKCRQNFVYGYSLRLCMAGQAESGWHTGQ